MKNNSVYFDVCVLVVLILCGFALYFIALQSKYFYFDDHIAIADNSAIKTIDIPKIFDAFNTRFLTGLSFALNYKFCYLHPLGYRLTNLLIHCLNAFLVYLLVKSTLYLYSARKPIFFCRLEWPAFFASMLFLCHPIQTEPVNFITQRFVLMGTFFYLLTLVLYIQYRCRSQKRYLIAAMVAAIAAMFCKEFVITLPLMLALYDSYFLHKETIWKRCRCLSPFFVIVLIVPLLLLRTPSQAVHVANIAESHGDITRARYAIGRKPYFLTELNVVCTYVRLLFLPVNQNFDYDYPISYEMDGKTLMSGVFLFCLLALGGVTYKSYRIISFSILWFFIALSVESSFIPIGDVITEYRPYLASVGFVFVVMSLIYMRKVHVKKLNIIAAVILIVFSILTYQRNKVWKDEFTLWNDTVGKSPHKARPYYARGVIYTNRGNPTQALLDYSKAIEIDPNYAEAYNNRGSTYKQQGNLTGALSDFNRAIEINPKYDIAYADRGNAYAMQGNLTGAISDLNKAIEIRPDSADYYNDRGNAYAAQGNSTQAISDLTKAIELNPKYTEAYNSRGIVYAKQNNFTQAVSDFTKVIELDPNNADAYNNRGFICDKQGNFTQALSDYNKAIELNPRLAMAYNNRGNVYYQLKEYDQAWGDVHKVEELGAVVDPNLINALKEASGRDL